MVSGFSGGELLTYGNPDIFNSHSVTLLLRVRDLLTPTASTDAGQFRSHVSCGPPLLSLRVDAGLTRQIKGRQQPHPALG